MCVCVCVCVCPLFLMHGRSYERIYTKFCRWYPYTLQIVVGVSERRSSSLACAQRAQIDRREVGKFRTSSQQP